MRVVFLILFVGFISCCSCALTEDQVAKTGKLMRKSCKTKSKSDDDELDRMKSGQFEGVSKKAKCYLACILQMTRLAGSDGHINYEFAKAQIPNLPERLREPSFHALETCKDKGNDLTDKCEIAFLLATCFYNDAPEHYIIP